MREKDQQSTAREKESWDCRSTRAKVTGSNPLWEGKFEAEGLRLGGEARGWWVHWSPSIAGAADCRLALSTLPPQDSTSHILVTGDSPPVTHCHATYRNKLRNNLRNNLCCP